MHYEFPKFYACPNYWVPYCQVPWYPCPAGVQGGQENPSSEGTSRRYNRTWNKKSVELVYERAHYFAQVNGKALSELELEDFLMISEGLPQTPEQCMAKIQEVTTAGTLKSGVWGQAEDEMLIEMLQNSRFTWGKIAKALNNSIHHGQPVRTGKKCKERWNNHLNPDIIRSKWTPAEDLAALQGYKKYGHKWTLIAKEIAGRTESNVKNRIKSLLNRQRQDLGGSSDMDLAEQAILKITDQ